MVQSVLISFFTSADMTTRTSQLLAEVLTIAMALFPTFVEARRSSYDFNGVVSNNRGSILSSFVEVGNAPRHQNTTYHRLPKLYLPWKLNRRPLLPWKMSAFGGVWRNFHPNLSIWCGSCGSFRHFHGILRQASMSFHLGFRRGFHCFRGSFHECDEKEASMALGTFW